MGSDSLTSQERTLIPETYLGLLDELPFIKYDMHDRSLEPVGSLLLEHSLRVGRLASEIGDDLWSGNQEVSDSLFVAGALHDIGKEEATRSDRSRLSPGKIFFSADTREIGKHTNMGYKTLKGSGVPSIEFAALVAALHQKAVIYSNRGRTGAPVPRGVEDSIDMVTSGLGVDRSQILKMLMVVSVSDTADVIVSRQHVAQSLKPKGKYSRDTLRWLQKFTRFTGNSGYEQLVVDTDDEELLRISTYLPFPPTV